MPCVHIYSCSTSRALFVFACPLLPLVLRVLFRRVTFLAFSRFCCLEPVFRSRSKYSSRSFCVRPTHGLGPRVRAGVKKTCDESTHRLSNRLEVCIHHVSFLARMLTSCLLGCLVVCLCLCLCLCVCVSFCLRAGLFCFGVVSTLFMCVFLCLCLCCLCLSAFMGV